MAKQKERDYAGKLYDTFHEQMEGFTKGETEFREALKSPDYQKKVYKTLSEQMDGFTRTESEFYGLLKKKENTIVPSESSGMANSTGGKNKLPVGVASQQLLSSYGVKPVSSKTTAKDIYKGVVNESKRQASATPTKATKPKDDRNIVEKITDPVVETLTSGVASLASGAAGLIGGTASLLVNKVPDNKQYPFLSYEWRKQKLIQQGEVKDPSWFSNQGIRDNFMKLADNLSFLASEESSIAKGNIGVKDSKKSSIDHVLDGNYKDAAKSALIDIGTQIPMLAAMVYSGGSTSTMAAMGATSTGSEMNRQYQQDGDINSTDALQAVSAGIVEVVAEKYFDMSIRDGGKIMDMLGVAGNKVRERIQKEGVDKVSKEMVRGMADVFKQGAKGFGQEWAEENIVSTVNYLARALDEDVFNEKEFTNFVKDLGNNALVAGPLGGGISVMAASASMTPLTTEEKTKINKYTEIINDQSASKEVKKIAQQKVQEIRSGKDASSEDTYNKVMALPIDERVIAVEKLNRISKLEDEASSVSDVDIKDSIKGRIAELRAEIEGSMNQFETTEYSSLDAIPDELKDKVSSISTINGRTTYRVTVHKTQEASVQSSRLSEIEVIQQELDSYDEEYNTLVDLVNSEERGIGSEKSQNEVRLREIQEKQAELINKRNRLEQEGSQPNIVQQITDSKVDTIQSVSDIESRMNNAEFIDEGDINKATDDLYSLHDQVSSEEKDGPEKEGLLLAIENKIKKLEGYEFETTSEVIEPGQTKAVSRGVKIIGTTTRGSKSKNTVTGERLDKKSVTVNNEKTGDVIDGEFVFSDGKLDILDTKTGKSSVFDTGKLEYVETGLDDSGVVSSITLKDNTTGDSFTINDPDIAIDLSIQEKIKQLGEINDAILEEVMQEVEVAPVVKTKVKEKATIPNPNPSVLPNIPISPQANTQAQPTSPSTPKSGENVTTPEEAAKLSEEMVDEESLAVSSFNEKMKKARKWFTMKKWVDRQSGIRKELNRAGDKVTEAFMTNVAGARAFADKRFESVEKKIYDKMELKDEKIFDQLAFHNRVIQIDENFDSRRLDAEIKIDELQKKLESEKARLKSLGKRPTLEDLKESTRLSKQIKQQKDNLKDKPLHPKGFNKETSRLAIQGIREKIGQEKFDDLNAKLGDFFGEFNKLLEEQYNAGLLNKETYDRFKEDKYIPRRFLSHLLIEPGTKNISPIAEKSLTKDQIKAIEGGSESLLFTDTRVLLNTAMRSSASRIAQNYANRALAETVNKLGKDNNIGKAANYSLGNGVIKTDAFGNKVVREAEPGYTNIFFFNEGKRDAVQVKNGMAKEFLDAEKKFDDFDPLLKAVLLNGVLKNLATGINATFFITNVPVDFVNTILFTSTYDDTNIFNASRKLSKSFAKNARNYTMMELGAKVDPEFEKTYQEWVENGGMMQFLTDQGRPDEVANRDSEIRNKKSLAPLNKAKKKVVGTLAFTGEVSEKAMRLSVFQKVKSDMVKDAGGRDSLSDRQYKELLAVAASASRKTMDFAQGGLFGKRADVFLPYLNASIQGLRVSVEYVASNPKKFIGKLAQASVPIAALMLYNMSMMDEPEEWQNVPPHERENYFIIFKPWKNDEGKREYLRIKKHPSIQWFTNAIEFAVIKTHDLLVDDKFKIDKGGSFIESEWSALNNALPIPLSFKKAFSKSPAVVQAGIAYVANFDLFKDEKISKDFGEVTPVLEGRYDKQVPLFYKEFAKATGASPKRTQAAVEKVVTNPETNAIVGLSYSLLDNMVTAMKGKPKIGTESKYQDVSPSGVANLFSARLVREIDPNYSKFKDTRAKDLAMELKSKDKEIKSDIKAILKAKGSGPALLGDAKSYVDKLDISKEEKPRLKKYAEDQFKLKTALASTPNAEFYLDLKYERDPRLKAFLFFDKYGVVDAETKAEVTRNANRLGYKLFGNDRFDAEYKKLINEQKALGKNR